MNCGVVPEEQDQSSVHNVAHFAFLKTRWWQWFCSCCWCWWLNTEGRSRWTDSEISKLGLTSSGRSGHVERFQSIRTAMGIRRYLFHPSEGGNILIIVSVCLFCLFVLPLTCLKNYSLISPKCMYMLLWPWLGPPLTTMQYVMYFRFCG